MAFNYWAVVKRLLGIGLPWDVINDLSGDTVALLLAFEDAVDAKQADDYADKKFL